MSAIPTVLLKTPRCWLC